MTLSSPILNTTLHVAEHVVAITCVSTLEPLCKPVIDKVAENLHHWPIAVFAGFAILIYLAGLGSARLIFRKAFGWRAQKSKGTVLEGEVLPPPPNTPALASAGEAVAIIVVAPASSIVSAAEATAAMISAAKRLPPAV